MTVNYYEVDLVETVQVSRIYIVAAESKDEAIAKAARGNTYCEYDSERMSEVVGRYLLRIRPEQGDFDWDEIG